MVGSRRDPHWLVRIEDPDNGGEGAAGLGRAWPLLAQRVAHSLKNPLTSMLLTLRRLEMEYRERAPAVAPRLDRYASRIEERIEELRRATRDFLKFVDLEAPELRPGDVNQLVREYSEQRARTLPPDIRLDVRLHPRLPPVPMDCEQIETALDNLVANAVNALPENGLITIATDEAKRLQWEASEPPRDYATIEVADTGAGIPDSIKPRLFEPGWSGRERGSGLGLAIVKKILADHGGIVTVESELGTGTAFTLYLPSGSRGGPPS